MLKRIVALTFIFICTSIAWMILGGITNVRTYNQDGRLKKAVGQLWGTVQQQQAPLLFQQIKKETKIKTVKEGVVTEEIEVRNENYPVILGASEIDVKIKLDQRKKGLLWYSVYRVAFDGKYLIKNPSSEARKYLFEYTFPTTDGVYDNFSFKIDGAPVEDLKPAAGKISEPIALGPGQEKTVVIAQNPTLKQE